jgi:isocitrate/isopropylmalate dehydrogenase
MAFRVAVIPGDKCGPEIVREGLKLLRQAQALGYGAYECTQFPWGRSTISSTAPPCRRRGSRP